MNIPDEESWGDAKDSLDLDLPYAYELFAGKSNDEVQEHFKGNPIERSAELRVMPIIPFQYYILGFRDYVMKGDFGEYDDGSDAASTYIRLILDKFRNTPEYVAPIFYELKESLEYIASNQKKFDADEDIYGSFKEIYNEILKLYENSI